MRWSQVEIDIVKSNPLLDSRSLSELLPNRSYDATVLKRRSLGLNFCGTRWESWEIEAILNNSEISDTEIHDKLLPHRTLSAIEDQRRNLKSKKIATCAHCGTKFKKINQGNSCPSCVDSYTNRYNKAVEGRYAQYKHSAKKRGYAFQLTLDFFKEKWNDKCTYCGDTINGVGFDRVDNNEGYIESNVVSCCEFCNEIKLNKTSKDFIAQLKKILRNLGETL